MLQIVRTLSKVIILISAIGMGVIISCVCNYLQVEEIVPITTKVQDVLYNISTMCLSIYLPYIFFINGVGIVNKYVD